jgi:hypothetical protein
MGNAISMSKTHKPGTDLASVTEGGSVTINAWLTKWVEPPSCSNRCQSNLLLSSTTATLPKRCNHQHRHCL